MNESLKIPKGEFFTCLDADSFIESKALKKMLPYFKDKRVGAVLPLMRVYKPRTMLAKMQWCEYIINLFMKNIMAMKDCVPCHSSDSRCLQDRSHKDIGRLCRE